MARITGKQIKDETIDENDIKDGSIKAAEMSPEAISGQTQKNSGNATNDRLLIWDSADSTLKKIAPNSLGISGGGSSTVLQDADNNTKIQVEEASDENMIRFDTAGSERMIIRDDGRVGIGVSSGLPNVALTLDGSGVPSSVGDLAITERMIHKGDPDTYLSFPANNTVVLTSGGNNAITIDDGGHVKLDKGIKYARGVLVSASDSPAEVGGWIKFATLDVPGTSNLDTAASSFLVTFAGMESSNNRALDGIFMVHAKFTVNTNGNADGGSNYYETEGTKLYCEPLNADRLAANGATDFNPTTDLIMITTNDDSTPVVDLYIKANAKDKHCFVTHLGGTGQTGTFDTDAGWTICTGQSWVTTEPAAPGGSAKITGTWVSKVFSKLGIGTSSPSLPLHVVGNTTMDGNLGIGTGNPQAPLHVEVNNGAGDLHLSSNKNSITQNHGLGNVFFVGTLDNGSTYRHGAMIHAFADSNWNAGSNSFPTSLAFKTCAGNALATRITIKSDGKTGIGTASPNEILTVDGIASLKESSAPGSTNSGYGKLYVDSSDSALKFQDDSGTNYNLLTTDLQGQVGIGYNASTKSSPVFGTSASDMASLSIHSHNSTDDSAAELNFSRYKATIADGTNLGEVSFYGSEDNSTYRRSAWIIAEAAEAWDTSSTTGTKIKFGVSDPGGVTTSSRVIIGGDSTVADKPQGVTIQGAAYPLDIDTISTSDLLVTFLQEGTLLGNISHSGGTVTYGPFTGVHLGDTEDSTLEFGDIVTVTSDAFVNSHQPVHSISKSSMPKEKSVFGVFGNSNDDSRVSQNSAVFSIGDGFIKVCSEGGNIENGDYICSSSMAGVGMKQDDDLMHAYTVAKATRAVTWDSNTPTIVLVPCTYHCG